ncbi:hypothetical protein R3P38DRAFT_2493253 [Favolaschia claudopus]|uniref:Uncharacterized protein n=1 Tax=Favolaschia claudopus TaxID=2862362 RepID=A0AAW0EK42_9AGAR
MSPNPGLNTEFYEMLETQLPLLAARSPALTRFDFRLPSHPLAGIPVGAIVDIIASIPGVTHVTVYGVYSYIISDEAFSRRSSQVKRPLEMRTLEVRTYQGVQLLTSALLAQHTLPNLNALTLRAGLDPIVEFVQRVGDQLDSLTLSFLEAPRAVPTIGRFIRYTTKLQNLQVFLLEPSPILNILSVLPAYNWDTISFVLINEDPRTVIHWRGIDHALTDVRFSTLRRFLLNRIKGVADTTPVLIPETRVFMPLASKRGLFG